jgi:hypothetical protein
MTCETCRHLDEGPTPCVCKKGAGQVSYIRKACAEYQRKREAKKK